MTDEDRPPRGPDEPEPEPETPETVETLEPETAETLEPETAAVEPPVPGAIEIVSRGLDLNLAASGAIRQASLYAAAMYLLLLGPIAFIFALVTARHGPELFDALLSGEVRRFTVDLGPAPGAFILGGLGALAISIDLQNIAVALIDAQASGRRPALRSALAIARRSFWPLIGASLASGLLTLVASTLIEAVLGLRNAPPSELSLLRQTVVQLVVAMPFAYLGAAVAIGRTGPIQAVQWSVRLARRRWRLAFVIGLVNTATSLLAAFAIGAGGDILGRIAIALGIGPNSGSGPLQVIELAVIVAVAIAAVGSLTMTIGALSVAPQVVAYRRLGGPRREDAPIPIPIPALTAEPDPSARVTPPSRPAPLITIGMWVVLALLAVLTAAAVVQFI